MCDNCKKGFKLTEMDMTVEAIKILEILMEFENNGSEITLLGFIEILRGTSSRENKKVRPNMIAKYSGVLKNKIEKQLRRLLIKMLKVKILKEIFVAVSYGHGENISTHLVPGRYASDLLNGEKKVFLSDGIRENANTY